MRAPSSRLDLLGPWQDLSGMDFGNKDGSFQWFSGASRPLVGSRFREARFDGVHLDQTDISLADFTGASMIRSGMGFVLAAMPCREESRKTTNNQRNSFFTSKSCYARSRDGSCDVGLRPSEGGRTRVRHSVVSMEAANPH